MPPFVVSHSAPLSPEQAWARVTDWPRHARYVPLTAITVDPPGPSRVGTVFTARTALGRYGFDDIMEIVEWQPPEGGAGGRCRIEKRGTAIRGWAELTVLPEGTGSRTVWREEARPARLPRFAEGGNALAGRLLFGRVLRRLLDDPS